MSLLERNLEALRAHGEIPEPTMRGAGSIVVGAARSGAPTLGVDGHQLHSQYDPEREAQRSIGSAQAPRSVVVLGFGLGYQAEACLARWPAAQVVIAEPRADLFRTALQHRDLTSTLRGVADVVVGEPAGLLAALRSLPPGPVHVVRLRSAVRTAPLAYRELDAILARRTNREEINRATMQRFGQVWVRNLARNATGFARARPLADLDLALQGIPAVILAGGPSLDQVLPDLKALANGCVLVAVDTTVAASRAAGITPDFVVSADPQYWNSRHLDAGLPDSTILVCDGAVHPRVLRSGRSVYLTESLFPLGELLAAAAGIRGRLGAGGSVATAAWDLARLLGADPILVAGLDLAYVGGRTHCRGTLYERLRHSWSTRLNPVNAMVYAATREAGAHRVPATGGGLVASDRRMQLYRWWFEEQLARPGAPRTLNLSSGGARIVGMTATVASSLKLKPARTRLQAVMGELRRPRREDGGTRAVQTVLQSLQNDLEAVARDAQRGVAVLNRLQGNRLDAAALERLNDIDRCILASPVTEVAGFLMQPLLESIQNPGSDDTQPAPEVVIERSQQLYKELVVSARYHAGLFGRLV